MTEQRSSMTEQRSSMTEQRITVNDRHEVTVNDRPVEVTADPNMPLLWVLRELLGLTGTKFGCGIAQCGACTVLLDNSPVRSCITPVSAVQGRRVTTIEGLSKNAKGRSLQSAWVEENVPQCGYCQSGMLMEAAALLASSAQPDDAAIDASLGGHICRCGTYVRIRKAIHRAASR